MTYTQLTQEQRYQIYALLKTEQSQTKIATVIGVNKSTISRGNSPQLWSSVAIDQSRRSAISVAKAKE